MTRSDDTNTDADSDTEFPAAVTRIVLLTDYTREVFDGTFRFLRDGGQFEVWTDTDTLYDHGFHPNDLLHVAGGTLVAFADGRVVGHGCITETEAGDVSGEVGIAVDDPLHVGPATPDTDVPANRGHDYRSGRGGD